VQRLEGPIRGLWQMLGAVCGGGLRGCLSSDGGVGVCRGGPGALLYFNILA
jgi:hypothetical protein